MDFTDERIWTRINVSVSGGRGYLCCAASLRFVNLDSLVDTRVKNM